MFNMCHIYRPPEWVAFPLTHFNKFPAESMILFWQIRLLHVKKNCFYESELVFGQFDRTFCNIWPVLLYISAPIFVSFYFLLGQATFVPVFQLFRGTSEKLDFIVMLIFMFLVN